MKKILSLTLAVMLLVSAIPTAFAAETQDYTMGTAVSYTADDEANREYTITVPASMEPGQSGTVTLKGKWASDETVKVTADANVVLTNSINAADTKTLAITFAGIEKAGDNVEEKTYTESVSVAAMPADALFGTWSGKFNYNVDFIEAEPVNLITLTIEGTECQAEVGMTWEQWIVSDYNTVGLELQDIGGYLTIRLDGKSGLFTNLNTFDSQSPEDIVAENTAYGFVGP